MRSRQTPFLPGGAKECNELDKGWKTAVLLEYLGATVDGKWKLRKLEPVDDVGNAPNVYGIKMYKVSLAYMKAEGPKEGFEQRATRRIEVRSGGQNQVEELVVVHDQCLTTPLLRLVMAPL